MKEFGLILALVIFSMYSFAQTWVDVAGGTNGRIEKLFVYDGKLTAVGDFSEAGGLSASAIAFYDGDQWSTIDNGYTADILDVLVKEDTIFAATNAGIIFWDGLSWQSYFDFGFLDSYVSIGVFQNQLYYFTSANYNICKIVGNQSVVIATPDGGVGGILVYNDMLYITGCFDMIGGVNSPHLAYYDGENFYSPGGGLGFGASGYCMAEYGGELYVGGIFNEYDGAPGNNLVKWNGEEFIQVDFEPNGLVNSLEVVDGKLYIGGDFSLIGETEVSKLGVWNGSELEVFNNFVGESYFSFVEFQGETYMGGLFESFDGNQLHNIAKYVEASKVEDFSDINNEVLVFPNPFIDKAEILVEDGNFDILIYDSKGSLLLNKKNIEGGKYEVSKNMFESGVYYYIIFDSKGKRHTGKIVSE